MRKGDTVRILPPRGSLEKGDKRLWRVLSVHRNPESDTARLIEVGKDKTERMSVTTKDLVVVAAFRDPLYPGLAETGRIERGGNKPFHTVINGENFHVLEMLTYTHRHKIDAIYIDPPYNTGAKDWKYNNDYVEGDDLYRHSKWLAMMERRLILAKELLNPENSVLIVTIDEKEVHRLGLLLTQIFPEGNVQTVASVINPQGTSRFNEFSRTNEYLFFVMIGKVQIQASGDNMFDRDETLTNAPIEWRNLRRRERESVRGARPNQFYAVFIDNESGLIHSVGEALPDDFPRQNVQAPSGTRVVFPLNPKGGETLWGVVPERLRYLVKNGFAKVGDKDTIQYLAAGTVTAIEAGQIEITGRDLDGGFIGRFRNGQKVLMPKTIWMRDSHNAQASGTLVLKHLLPDRTFPFPKSLYAVEDALRFFVANKREAIVLDFFSGSGTTAHAVMRLNRQDDGRRQCISVTNNEVGTEEQTELRGQGLRPGDPDWEQWGICDYITKPRIQAAITGKTPDGQPISGDYRFTDEFPMSEGFEENAVFFTLTYEGQLSVSHHRAFDKVAPLFWLRAGSVGRIIDTIPKRGWDVAEAYGVLVALDETAAFVKAMSSSETVRIAYIVTDDDRRFQMICAHLPDHITTVRLYESYLANFQINSGRCA